MAWIILIFIFLLYLAACTAFPPLWKRRSYRNSRTMQQIEPAAALEEERVLCIDDNEDALFFRLLLISAAEKSLVLSSHDFRADESGQDMISALLDAAGRGVHVRILVDGLADGVQMKKNLCFRVLAMHPNIEFRVYNQPHFYCFWKINYRMHDKYLIVDDRYYILGGRNTNDLFLGNYRSRHNIDRDILVCVPEKAGTSSIKDLQEYFRSVWALPCSKQFLPKITTEKMKRTALLLQKRYAVLYARYSLHTGKEYLNTCTFYPGKVMLLSNPAGCRNKEPLLWNTLCYYMKQGKEVLFQTPYIICSKQMYRDIRDITGSGAAVCFLTNSVFTGANLYGSADYLNNSGRLLKNGAVIYECASEHSLHTKTILIDGSLCITGSFNLDMRSAYLDTELMLLIDSRDFVTGLSQEASALQGKSLQRNPDGSIHKGPAYHLSPIPVLKDLRLRKLRIVAHIFRYLF